MILLTAVPTTGVVCVAKATHSSKIEQKIEKLTDLDETVGTTAADFAFGQASGQNPTFKNWNKHAYGRLIHIITAHHLNLPEELKTDYTRQLIQSFLIFILFFLSCFFFSSSLSLSLFYFLAKTPKRMPVPVPLVS